MTNTDTPLRISGPAELLTAIPTLLGFHPEDSLVLVGLTAGKLVVTARVDLADADDGTVRDTLEAIARGGATEAIAAAYSTAMSEDGGELPHRAVMTGLAVQAATAGVVLTGRLLVAHGSWWSYDCANLRCCPAAGNLLPTGPTTFQAEAVYAGLTVADNREALGAVLTPQSGRDELRPLLDAVEQVAGTAAVGGRLASHELAMTMALFAAARAATDGSFPSDEQAASYGAAQRRDPRRGVAGR